MKEKLLVSAKQIEWEHPPRSNLYNGSVAGKTRYQVFKRKKHIYGTTFGFKDYASLEEAKQACQDHLQQYVDGLLLQLRQLTEIENEDQ